MRAKCVVEFTVNVQLFSVVVVVSSDGIILTDNCNLIIFSSIPGFFYIICITISVQLLYFTVFEVFLDIMLSILR